MLMGTFEFRRGTSRGGISSSIDPYRTALTIHTNCATAHIQKHGGKNHSDILTDGRMDGRTDTGKGDEHGHRHGHGNRYMHTKILSLSLTNTQRLSHT